MAQHPEPGPGGVRTSGSAPAQEPRPAAPAGPEAAAGATHAELAAQVAELAARVVELEDRWRRALAEADNVRKRCARDMERQRAEEQVRVAAAWLPVLDNLDLALTHADADPGTLVEGIRAVRDQGVDVLARLGFPRREDLGESFDPARHEAVTTVVDENAPPGTVVHVVRPGYGDAERLLRPAGMVVAARAP